MTKVANPTQTQTGQDSEYAALSYAIGDSINWDAEWIDICLWTELPFWLMVNNTSIAITNEGHEFQIAVHDDYWELFVGTAGDSRSTVGYRGPLKKPEDLPTALKELIEEQPSLPLMWRKCKTYLKVVTRCNEHVWSAVSNESQLPKPNEVELYVAELCRAHIPVINALISSYRVATYDFFAFEVSPWDVPVWSIERDELMRSCIIVSYRGWDAKPLIHENQNGSQEPQKYSLIEPSAFQDAISQIPTPGELEMLDALNLMQRGDYSGAVRRITTAIEVIVEDVVGRVVELAEGAAAAKKFILRTRTRFEERLRMYEKLSSRKMPEELFNELKETRSLRHRIVHTGYRIDSRERGVAQRAVDTGRWIFNWIENSQSRSRIRERQIAFRSLGRDLEAGIFNPRITSEGVLLSRVKY